jgi:hypothetical protein
MKDLARIRELVLGANDAWEDFQAAWIDGSIPSQVEARERLRSLFAQLILEASTLRSSSVRMVIVN